MTECKLLFVDGIATLGIYEFIKEIRMRGHEECILKYDHSNGIYELYEQERRSKRNGESHIVLIPCELRQVNKLERKQVYPINSKTYFAGDKIC